MKFKIVAVFFFLFSIIHSAGAQPGAATADLIFSGGTIDTVISQPAEALAVKDGKILAVGPLAKMAALTGPNTQKIDLQGRILMPGFIEPHGHPFDSSLAQFFAVDVRPFSVKDAAQLNAAIAGAIRKAKPGEWVLINGIDPLLQKDVRNPTLQQLNTWAPRNPLVLIANSGHAAFGNSLALKAAGITDASPNPPGASYVKGADGHLTGTVEELPAVNVLLNPVLATLTPAKMTDLLRTYFRYLTSHGITAVSDMSFKTESLPIYQAVEKDALPPPRVFLYEIARPDGKGTLPPGGGSEFVRQNGIKWWADGSPWLGTIALSKPMLNNDLTLKVMGLKPDDKGQLNYSDAAALQKSVEGYYAQGYQIAIHAEGELAIDQALTVLEAAAKKYPRPDARPRLQHVPLISGEQLQRAKRLGAYVSFLMTHIYYWGDLLPEMFGPERAANWNPVGLAAKAGVPFSFHNDGPVTPADPLLDLQVAVLRRTQGGGKVLGEDQRVTIDQAIQARTLQPARELLAEKEIGSLEPGKRADLVILDKDPRRVPPEEISKIKVEATYIGGKQVYAAASR